MLYQDALSQCAIKNTIVVNKILFESDMLSHLMFPLHPANPDVILVRLPCSLLYNKQMIITDN